MRWPAIKRSDVDAVMFFRTSISVRAGEVEEALAIRQPRRPAVGAVDLTVDHGHRSGGSAACRNGKNGARWLWGKQNHIARTPTAAPSTRRVCQVQNGPGFNGRLFELSLCKKAQPLTVWGPKRVRALLCAGQG